MLGGEGRGEGFCLGERLKEICGLGGGMGWKNMLGDGRKCTYYVCMW